MTRGASMLSVLLVAWPLVASPLGANSDEQKERRKGPPPGLPERARQSETLDSEVYRCGEVIRPAGRDGVETIRIEGKMIRVMESTREILDVLGN